jgi:hypothetical protein
VWTCFVLLGLVGLTACITPRQEGSSARYRHCASGAGCPQVEPVRGTQVRAPRGEVGSIQSELLDVDYFQGLLVRAGVPSEQLPKDRRGLSPAEAVRLLSTLLSAEVGLRDFGPWRMAAHLLWEVVQGGAPVSREVLHERMRRLVPLLVLRPDGYLVKATTGRAVQYAGAVRLDRQSLRAEGFEVGPFYTVRGHYLYPVEADLELHPDTVMAGVWAPDEDTVRPMLEGAGAAVVDTVTGLVTFVLHPIDSLAGLAQLPGAVRTLIENSPEYWEQFRAMPHGAQVRAVSRLLTNVLITFGTAGVGSARVVEAGSRLGNLGVPILSLSAKGTLGLRLVAVPTGQLVTAIGPAVGGAYVLHMANMGSGGGGTPPGIPASGGPGRWEKATESMKPPARKYQAQITGAPEGYVYKIGDVKFDGYKDGVLLEVKGPGYLDFFKKDGDPKYWFRGAESMVKQAERQLEVANDIPIEWHFAEREVADTMRALFHESGLDAIKVVHTRALPLP